MITHSSDYLIVGAGAMGMAFADALLTDSDATLTIVDREAAPGGHWNHAYPFVTLHQPSAYYGVNSRELGSRQFAVGGLNDGLEEMATGAEVSAYFRAVMDETLLPSGRVRYFPEHEFLGEGQVRSLRDGSEFTVDAPKHVDATWLKTTVPATHTPNFEVAESIRFMPLNNLPNLTEDPDGYVVIGGGKTGIDACLWLLGEGVDPDRITWIVSRDAWLLNRRNAQPHPDFFHDTMGNVAAQFDAIAAAESVEDMFDRLEACGYFLRLDTGIRPTMFHGATISEAELVEMRRLTRIVRMGHVTEIQPDRIALQRGEIATTPNTVHVDCSASAIENLETCPIFEDNRITLQTVRSYQPAFSAALIGYIEASRDSVAEKNRLCQVVPLPNHDTDFVRFTSAFMMNQYNWGQEEDIRAWLKRSRLDGFTDQAQSAKGDPAKEAVMNRIKLSSFAAAGKLQQFLAKLDRAAG